MDHKLKNLSGPSRRRFIRWIGAAGAALAVDRSRLLNFVSDSGGTALADGMTCAATNRSVHIVGDGGFYFGNLDSVFAVSAAHKLPIFSIIIDNSGWNAVKDATLRVYPEGTARARDAFQSRLPAGMRFSKLAEVSGAYGECLSDPKQVGAAIDRLLRTPHPSGVARAALVITHTGFILDYIKADVGHMMVDGRIVYSGPAAALFKHIQRNGYRAPSDGAARSSA